MVLRMSHVMKAHVPICLLQISPVACKLRLSGVAHSYKHVNSQYSIYVHIYIYIHCSLSSLTLHIIVHNAVSVQIGQCLESAPEDVFGVVHHQLQHGGLLLVLHQEVGEGTVAHLGQVALQVTTHAGHEVVAEVVRGTLGVLLTHHHCLEGEDVVVRQ